jgi:uncharacterized protein
VNLLVDGPADAATTLILGHGAGAGMDSRFLGDVAQRLGASGVRVVRFEFPYMAARREGRRPGPDRMPVLEKHFEDVVAEVRRGTASRVAVGGKSMGGRVATRVADRLGADRVVVFGYPFHPPGKPQLPEPNERTTHLRSLVTPSLLVQGTRDPFGTRDDVAGYDLSPAIRLLWVEDGDHDLKCRKSVVGRTPAEALAAICAEAARFLQA